MQRLTLERQQVWVYLAGIILGLLLGTLWPGIDHISDWLLWPALMLLLFATFVQVPLLHLREAFSDHRFVLAVLLGNFVLLPLLVWGLLQWLPDDSALRLGVLLVLLVPCTDWFITFSQLGGGNVPRAIAITPLNLLVQLLLLPLYLWLMADAQFATTLGLADVWPAVLVVLLTLLLAPPTQRWIEARAERERVRDHLAWWPIPLLGLVLLLIAAAQVGVARSALELLPVLLPLFAGFLMLAALLAKALAVLLGLPREQGRTLAFSMGTRNSFVMLPFAVALPAGWELVALVIVLQSLVELFGMLLYLWVLPRYLFR